MLNKIALILLIIGGLNWGLIGIFQLDAVAWLFGGASSIISSSYRRTLVYFPIIPPGNSQIIAFKQKKRLWQTLFSGSCSLFICLKIVYKSSHSEFWKHTF